MPAICGAEAGISKSLSGRRESDETGFKRKQNPKIEENAMEIRLETIPKKAIPVPIPAPLA